MTPKQPTPGDDTPARKALFWAVWDNYTIAQKNRFINDFAHELAEQIRNSEELRDLTDDHMSDCNAAADLIDPEDHEYS